MSILKLKDKDGNWISVPTIKGDPGEQGVPGKDANVTKENIERALGFTPASEKSVTDVDHAKLDKPEVAPEVGKVLKVKSVNPDGSFVCEWADDANDGSVTDVQVNGTSVVQGGVASLPYVTGRSDDGGAYGLVKCNSYNGITAKNGVLQINEASNTIIAAHQNRPYPITAGNFDYAVKCAMADGKGPKWTDNEKQLAMERIGVDKQIESVREDKQDKLIAGENITISEDGKTISAIASMKHLYFEYEEFTIEDVCNLETGCYYFHEWIDVDQDGTKWEETGYYGFDGLCSVDVFDNQVWVACYDYGIWYTFFKDGKLKDCGDNFSATNPNYAAGKYGIKYSSSEGLWIAEPNDSEITSRVNYKPITPARMDFAVKAALTDGKGAASWSDTEKAAAREMIGVGGYESRISALESALIDVDTAISRLEQAL